MKRKINTWEDLFNHIDLGPLALGQVLGVSRQTAHYMRRGQFINPVHWNNLVAWSAENRPEITHDLLGRIAADFPSGKHPPPKKAAAE